MKGLSLICFSFILISCERNDREINTFSELREVKSKIVRLGDEKSFERLAMFDYFSTDSEYIDALPYSMIAADKYDNSLACLNCYFILIKMGNNKNFSPSLINNLSIEKRELALHYLKKGARLGESNCRTYMLEHYEFGYGVEKNSFIVDSLNKVKENVVKKDYLKK